MLGYIKMHEPTNDLSSLLEDTKHLETKLVSYLENEQEQLKKKQAYMIFTNSNALIDAAQENSEGECSRNSQNCPTVKIKICGRKSAQLSANWTS